MAANRRVKLPSGVRIMGDSYQVRYIGPDDVTRALGELTTDGRTERTHERLTARTGSCNDLSEIDRRLKAQRAGISTGIKQSRTGH